MSLITRIRGAFAREEKRSRAGALLALHTIGAARWTPRDYVALTREGFERNAIAHRCVRMIAESVATIPWCAYEGAQEIPDHPFLALLARPNPGATTTELIESLVTSLLLFGNAYVEGAQIDGALREIYCLRADRMSVVAGPNGWPAAYDYVFAGDRVRYEMRGQGVEPILHMRLAHPLDDHYGLPPLAAAHMAIDTHNAAGFWNKALLDNAARPSGALVYGAGDGAQFTDAQFDRLKAELEENFAGAANAGRPLLLDGGLDWKALSLSPKDMDFIDAKAAAAREIALCFGVPPLVLGLPGDNTHANYQEANRAFWRGAVIPMVARLQRAFEHWLRPAWPELRLDHDLDRIDALAEERAAEWARVGAANFLTDDEKRAALGYGARAEPRDRAVTPFASGQAPERRYSPDQARDELGKWTSESDDDPATLLAGIIIRICVASGIARFTDEFGNKSYSAEYECRDGSVIVKKGVGDPKGFILDPIQDF